MKRTVLFAAAAMGLAACTDKPVPTQVTSSKKVRIQITTSFDRQNAPAATFINMFVAYPGQPTSSTGGGKDTNYTILGNTSVPAVSGTQQFSLTIDLTKCLNDSGRLSSAPGTCPLVILLTLGDSTDNPDHSEQTSLDETQLGPYPVKPGDTPPLPAVITLAVSRFTAHQWIPDPALQLGNAAGNFTTALTGLGLGTAQPILFAGSQDTLGSPAIGMFQNGLWSYLGTKLPQGSPGLNNFFNRIVALSPTDMWIAAGNGLFHYDGSAAINVGGITDNLFGVAALVTPTGGHLVFAVGNNGLVLQGDGTTFTRNTLSSETLSEVCITSPTEAFIAGLGGTLWRWNGSTFVQTPVTAFPNRKIELECPAPGQAFVIAAQQALLKWNGSGWTQMSNGAGRFLNWGVSSANEIYAYGDSLQVNRAFYLGNGSIWRELGRESFATQANFNGNNGSSLRMWADPRGGAAYALSAFGRLEQTTSAGGVRVLSYQPSFRDLMVTSPTSAFAVGAAMLLARWNGSAWTIDKPPASMNTTRILQGVWSDGASNAWAVGNSSVVLHWDGTSWSAVSDSGHTIGGVPTDTNYTVWGQGSTVLIAGSARMYRCTSATNCAIESAPTGGPLFGLWGTGLNNVYAVGGGGRIVHYDGTSWTNMPSPARSRLSRVWGSSATDVWAVGDSVLVHYNGTAWSTVPITGELSSIIGNGFPGGGPPNISIFQMGLWGSGPTDVYVAGNFGQIARYDGTQWRNVTQQEVTRNRIVAISGVSGYGALAATESQLNLGSWPVLLRGIGPAGGFGAPMGAPSAWP